MRNETKFSYFNRRRCVSHENVLDFRIIRIDEMMKSITSSLYFRHMRIIDSLLIFISSLYSTDIYTHIYTRTYYITSYSL